MSKPIYYLWIDKDTDMDELEKEKQLYIECGFKVYLLDNTSDNDNIEEGVLNIIKNHIS